MCGGFALHLARDERRPTVALRLFLFLLGKAFTYVFLGALVGGFGLWIVQSGWVPGARKVLVVAAALVTILLGLLMLELPLRLKLPAVQWPGAGLLEGHTAKLLAGRSLLGPLVFGLAVGYLPCPLTAILLIVAAGEHSVGTGMLLLGGAGLGTMPGLFTAGLAGSAIWGKWRAVGTKVLGSLVIVVGVLMLLRRFGVITTSLPGACH